MDKNRMIEVFETQAKVVDGVVRWISNGRVPPQDVLDAWQQILPAGSFSMASSAKARAAETAVFLDEYRRAHEGYAPSAEEMAEMRASFGSGTTVVNVVTGRRTRL